jgi:hypothetical protein
VIGQPGSPSFGSLINPANAIGLGRVQLNPRMAGITFPFGPALPISINQNGQVSQLGLDFIQSAIVDNSFNPMAFTLSDLIGGLSYTVPPFTTTYLQLAVPGIQYSFTGSTTGGMAPTGSGVTPVNFNVALKLLNVPVIPQNISAFNPNTNNVHAWRDLGPFTLTGSAQLLIPTNALRVGWAVCANGANNNFIELSLSQANQLHQFAILGFIGAGGTIPMNIIDYGPATGCHTGPIYGSTVGVAQGCFAWELAVG